MVLPSKSLPGRTILNRIRRANVTIASGQPQMQQMRAPVDQQVSRSTRQRGAAGSQAIFLEPLAENAHSERGALDLRDFPRRSGTERRDSGSLEHGATCRLFPLYCVKMSSGLGDYP